MNQILDILRGIVIGIANIIPGVSGGTMAVSMGIYDKLIGAVTGLFRHFKDSIRLLLPLGIGMAIGIVAGTLGIPAWLAGKLVPYLQQIDSNAGSSMFAYWVGVVANLVLTPVAAATSLSVPMAEIATSLNLGIKPILYSFLYGLDQFFLPYELAPALIMFATGYVRVRYLIGIMLTRMVLASLIVAFVATFIWPMMNL